jgi:hypothetical protein
MHENSQVIAFVIIDCFYLAAMRVTFILYIFVHIRQTFVRLGWI